MWTEVDDRDFHRYAYCVLAGWVEMIAPARREEAVLLVPRAAITARRPLRTRSLAWRWGFIAALALVLLWIAV